MGTYLLIYSYQHVCGASVLQFRWMGGQEVPGKVLGVSGESATGRKLLGLFHPIFTDRSLS